jgi:AcrR family transcriptional regulator
MAMGRPRTSSDEEILAGTARAIARVGPARLTLADVGREVGLAPATLVQRFGSKRELLLALVRRSATAAADRFPDETTRAVAPLQGLIEAMAAMTSGLTAEALSHHLAFLQLDLTDAEFRQLAGTHARAVRDQIRLCLDAAVTRKQLRALDTERLALSVQVAYNGALITWALEPEGPAERRVREEISAVLSAATAPAAWPLGADPDVR